VSKDDAELERILTKLISETNGVSLIDTLELASHSVLFKQRPAAMAAVQQFRTLLFDHSASKVRTEDLFDHPVAKTLERFLKRFPLPFQEEHTHLTGSLDAGFVFPRLQEVLDSPNAEAVKAKIVQIYGEEALPIRSEEQVADLLRMPEDESFGRYLQVLTLPKLVLVDRKAHADAAYHMARTTYRDFNVGRIRLKFSLSRVTTNPTEALPGSAVAPEEVVLGLYDGFERFRSEEPKFDYVLSPSFRKEADFYDATRFGSKREDFLHQVQTLLELLDEHPFLREKVTDVDTVGDERGHYRKRHFEEMRVGFRQLQFAGFSIRSHHGETWRTLKQGVQAVDNAMNIWHIDALEHGVALGVNPNFYFHMVFERVLEKNTAGVAIGRDEREGHELFEMDWNGRDDVRDKLFAGTPLSAEERRSFIKTKFHTAREVEHYQHDVLNRMINKGVGLVALPSSNIKLTNNFPNYKDHPFSWWEKKGLHLAVGTDNYVTLDTNLVREMLILLFTDMENLKITKLLMVVTGETRRPVISSLLWGMREGD
jgi:adenosine deaminase